MSISSSNENSVNGLKKNLNLQSAMDEASRCLLCHDAPCSQQCPAGTDPAKFIRKIHLLNFKGAARTILTNNPLGGVCGLVCPTDKLCAQGCSRAGLDKPIKIGALQKFAVDYGRSRGFKIPLPNIDKNSGKKVAIIGAGPCGLSAARELALLGHQVTIFETKEQAGGILRYGVPEFRCQTVDLDQDLADILTKEICLKTNHPIQGENAVTGLLEQGFQAVLVAVGLQKQHNLNLPGSDLEGVTDSANFLCSAKIDGANGEAAKMVANKNVAIIGGGSVAMDAACTARYLGAKKIYAISLEALQELPAAETDLELARANHIIFKSQCIVENIKGENNIVTQIDGVECEWIEPGILLPHNARPIPDTNFSIKVGAVIQAIGAGVDEINQEIFASLNKLNIFNKQGNLIETDDDSLATSSPGIFAGGDISRGASTVVEAVRDGKNAAVAINKYLQD